MAGRLAVLTSGGDAPGMNAAIRAVARMAAAHDVDVLGVTGGYSGLVHDRLIELEARTVGNIIHRGGTLLGTSRCPEFHTVEGRATAAAVLDAAGVTGLVVIGGDGSYRGAEALMAQWSGQVVGLPGTIDNDISGTDATIGFDTAVNTALEAIDRIRDTAEATERVFFVEVMGRHCGAIAVTVAIAAGAIAVLTPEVTSDLGRLVERLKDGRARGRRSSIVVVAEGEHIPGEHRVSVLGHIQRGGSPSASDRVLATRLGAAAVEALLAGEGGFALGLHHGEVIRTPFRETWERRQTLDARLADYVFTLAG